ncbi:hypothetical protein Glove_41g69 [Diversispora epigaea]|uniref:Uncharacterized protein n=1 Tax=Diversispora epigaea TaxID=1348612 RepID=A0A397JRB1_9GLOM|nr:hypothetical protein Glove_41g69 [Diversispora epigaea]
MAFEEIDNAITRKLTNDKKIYIAYDVSGKLCNVEIRYLQNIKLESTSHMNKKKQTAEQEFQNDYLYGIVSTALLMFLSQILSW